VPDDAHDRNAPGAPNAETAALPGPRPASRHEPSAHRQADRLSEWLLLGMVVFSPWALAGWPAWSVWTLNVGGYLLWLLLAVKGIIRRRTGYQPLRWTAAQPAWTGRVLAMLTVLVLLWCLVSALNARATVDVAALRLRERADYLPWLPHSFDAPSTWFTFWTALGLAGVFWATRDWLTQLTRRERHLARQAGESAATPNGPPGEEVLAQRGPHFLPRRLKRLLWVLCVNGTLVALVGVAGTLRPSQNILGLFPHPTRQGGFFGPFWYRNNGAQYLNLLWPAALALWHAFYLRAADSGHFLRRLTNSPALALLPCVGFMTAAPFVTTSRGGTLISLLVMLACLAVLLPSAWRRGWRWALPLVLVPVGAGAGLLLAWAPLADRFLNEFRILSTGAKAGFEAFTVRCVVTVPPNLGRRPVNLVVLSDSGRSYDQSSNIVMLRFQGEGRVAVRFLLDARDRVLELTGTNAALAQAGRTLELILAQAGAETRLYLDGAPVPLVNRAGKGGFAWPERFASRYAWVGRGDGADIIRGRIRAVTLLDRALSAEEIAGLARRPEQPGAASPGAIDNAPWGQLRPAPLLNLDWGTLSPARWKAAGLGGRTSIYEDARRMMAQYPAAFGSGPGTFANLYKVHLRDPQATDAWYVHNDHLETRLTFGWLGAALVYLLLAAAVAPVLVPGGLRAPRYFTLCLLIGLGGALLHARFDFVFQTHALLFLAVVLCSLLSILTLRGAAR
jgi:hypothetical protein